MITAHDTIDSIEVKLTQALSGLTWIGELPIDKTAFDNFRRTVQLRSGQKNSTPASLPPCTLAAVMVFCARYATYADDEHLNFWSKFFSTVLKKDPKPPQAENAWRDAFKSARDHLKTTYGLEFPTRDQSRQHIVGGIYLHAILPAYLQDDFAAFFLKAYPDPAAWAALDTRFADELAQELEQASFPPPLLPRLSRFLTHAETSLTAARLIKTLATAAQWYHDGLSTDSIGAVLSPIEAAVWKELVGQLPPPPGAEVVVDLDSPRTRPPRLHWAWLFEQNDILELHIRNLRLTSPTPPDRVVWLPSGDGVTVGQPVPDYGRRYCEVNAWHTPSGYVIDTATLIDIGTAGVIVPVDRDDHALAAPIPTPSPPHTGQPACFRIGTEGQLGVLRDLDRLLEGEYAVSLPPGQTITALPGGTVTQHERLLIPQALPSHTTAARYTLKPPLLIGDRRIDRQRTRTQPIIEGDHLIAGLLPDALPVYQHGEVWVRLTLPADISTTRLTLRLTINETIHLLPFSQLEQAGQITRTGDEVRIRLTDHVPAPALFQVEVFSGGTRMHGDPRQAGLLPPAVTVTADPVEQFYTIHQRPNVRVTGVSADQIRRGSDAEIGTAAETVTVTWQDPRQDAALRLQFGAVELPLTFAVQWLHGWVEPLAGDLLFEDALNAAVLHIRGPRHAVFTLHVGDEPRMEQLNARGVLDVPLREHPLCDLLKQYHGGAVPVTLTFAGQPSAALRLFRFIRPQFAEFEQRPALIKRSIQAFRTRLAHTRGSSTQPDRHLLLLVPVEYTAALPTVGLPDELRWLQQAIAQPPATALSVFPPWQEEVRVGTKTYPVHGDVRGKFITVPAAGGRADVQCRVEVTPAADGLHLHAPNLYQCSTCGDLYWKNDVDAKIIHGHGKFGIAGRDLATTAVDGTIARLPVPLDAVRAWEPVFHALLERDLQNHYRIRGQQKAHGLMHGSEPAPLSVAAYRYATAHWTTRLAQIERPLGELKQAAAQVEPVCTGWLKSSDPALIWAARWLLTEQAARTSSDTWKHLDLIVLLLAMIARGYAHGCTHFHERLAITYFETLLKTAQQHCDPLLRWALAWAELNFIYWADQRRQA